MNEKQTVIHKDRILNLAASKDGFHVNIDSPDKEALRGRLKIFELKGLVKEERRTDKTIFYKITKETHLL